MEQYANRPVRKQHKPGNPITNGHDNEEQVHELRELQRNLAERIRKIQRGAQYSNSGETA